MINQAFNIKRAEIAFKALFWMLAKFYMFEFLHFTIFLTLCCNYCG